MSDRPNEAKRIGQLLLEGGLISERQLAEALSRQASEGGRICSQLIRLGHLKADDLLEFLGRQFGVAAVNLSSWSIPPDVLGLIPAETVRRFRVVPVNVLDRTLALAMENPRDTCAVEEVERITGLSVDPLIVPQASMDEAIRRYYGSGTGLAPAIERKVLVLDESADRPAVYDPSSPKRALSPVETLKRIVFLGIKRRSREIHLEPREDGAVARLRVGSRLVNGEEMSHAEAGGALAVLLDHAGLGQSDRGPVEGWIRVRVRSRELKLVFSASPVLHGWRVVMRLADEGQFKRTLGDLGMDADTERILLECLDRRQGILLIASPSVQERRLTLYHLLGVMRSDALNLLTVEPWVLFPVQGVSQTIYGPLEGRSQPEVFRAAMRQEPDIVGVADLDSREMLEPATAAALRSLVLGTVPHDDTHGTLAWLSAFRQSRLALAHVLTGVLAVRFLPKLCPDCRRAFTGKIELRQGARDIHPDRMRFWESPGCDRCERTGRAGQTGLFEVFVPDGELRGLMAEGSPPRVIYEEAQRRGMRTLLEAGIGAAVAGEVDIRDVLRSAPAEP